MSAIVGAVLLASVTYLFGRWQEEHKRLYEERARVIALLFERFETLDQRLSSLINIMDMSGEPDKEEKAKLAAESFNDVWGYYRRNSIWLSRKTSERFGEFLENYKHTFQKFQMEVLMKKRYKGTPDYDEWDRIWQRFKQGSPEVRGTLETEFRASLGDMGARFSQLLDYAADFSARRKTISGSSRNLSEVRKTHT